MLVMLGVCWCGAAPMCWLMLVRNGLGWVCTAAAVQKSRSTRQWDAATALSTMRATYYSLGLEHPSHINQKKEMGDALAAVRTVRCDLGSEECKGLEAPAWKIGGVVHAVRLVGGCRDGLADWALQACGSLCAQAPRASSSTPAPQAPLTLEKLEELVKPPK